MSPAAPGGEEHEVFTALPPDLELEAWLEGPIGPQLPPPPPEDPIEVHWYCGMFLKGTERWFDDPDECETEWTTTEEREHWEEEHCSSYCPHCRALVSQTDGHAEVGVDSPPLRGLQ